LRGLHRPGFFPGHRPGLFLGSSWDDSPNTFSNCLICLKTIPVEFSCPQGDFIMKKLSSQNLPSRPICLFPLFGGNKQFVGASHLQGDGRLASGSPLPRCAQVASGHPAPLRRHESPKFFAPYQSKNNPDRPAGYHPGALTGYHPGALTGYHPGQTSILFFASPIYC